MASAAGLRPNHYEVLGLLPAASQDEITRAFARGMSLFGARSMAAAAQMSLAFEVLRNPAKRRAYDREIGLTRPPEPQPRQWTVTASIRSGPGLIGSAWGDLARQVAGDPPLAAQRNPEPEPQAPSEPKLASFIASSLREPTVESAPKADPRPRPERVETKLQRHVEQAIASKQAEEDAEDRPLEWKKPALAVGVLVLAAGLIGTLAGISVRDAENPAQAEDGVTIAVPKAKPVGRAPARAAAPTSAPAQGDFQIVPQRPVHSATRPRRIASPDATAAAPVRVADDGQNVASAVAVSPPVDVASDPLAPAPAEVTSATMPLPNRVIARTIERIGYRCGEVASTAAVEGSPGVFKVTCSSGQAYQASPVRGRYHFRRLGSQ